MEELKANMDAVAKIIGDDPDILVNLTPNETIDLTNRFYEVKTILNNVHRRIHPRKEVDDGEA